MPRWATWAIVAVVVLLIAGPRIWPTSTATSFTYTEFLELVKQGQVQQVEINNLSNQISGTLKDGGEFVTTGAVALSDADETLLKEKGVDYDYSTPQGNFFTNLIPLLLPFILIMGFFFYLNCSIFFLFHRKCKNVFLHNDEFVYPHLEFLRGKQVPKNCHTIFLYTSL
ncbi:MAG: ATP-dependent protease FtsH [Actinomycetota bacterium]